MNLRQVNWRYVFGTITIVSVVGLTIYSIKKAKDQQYIEEHSMSHEEVMAEFKERTKSEDDILKEKFEEFDKQMNPVQIVRTPMTVEKVEVEVIEEVDSYRYATDVVGYTYDGIDMHIPIIDRMTEEDTTLRHEPNSNEARTQFIKMQLAEWAPSDPPYSLLIKLFDQPFIPQNDGDSYLRENLEEPREKFFGKSSRWVKEVSMADVLLHFAHKAQYELNEDVTYWMDQFLHHNEFSIDTPQRFFRQLVSELNNHEYHNADTNTYGIFGLSSEAIDEAEHYASKNVENSLTYDLEFNEFIKERV